MNVIEFSQIENRQRALQDLQENHPDIITRSRNIKGKFYLSFESTQIGIMIDGLVNNFYGVLKPELANEEDYKIDKYAVNKFNGRNAKKQK